MRNLSRSMLAVTGLLLVLVILTFMLENQQPVSLQFLGWAAPQLPVSVVVVIALLIGMLAGPLLRLFLGRQSRLHKRMV